MKNIHEILNRIFYEKHREMRSKKIENEGYEAAKAGKLGVECPYYGTDEESTKDVKAWFKGYYRFKDEKK